MAQCYLKGNELKLGYLELLDIDRMDPGNALVHFELGKIYAGQRLTAKAITSFEKYLIDYPGSAEGRYWLARAYLDAGVPNKAYAEFEKVINYKYTDEGWVYYYIGLLALDQKKATVALQNFTAILKMGITNSRLLSETHRCIALCYKEKGLIDEALTSFDQSEFYSKSGLKDGVNKDLLFDQGLMYYKKGDNQRALEKFQRLRIVDNKYRNVEKIVFNLMKIIKGDPDAPSDAIGGIAESSSYASKILRRGILYSSIRIEIDSSSVSDKSSSPTSSNSKNHPSMTGNRRLSVEDFISMPIKDYKEVSRKLLSVFGVTLKNEIRFAGDQDYIDGNAINFIVVQSNSAKPEPMVLTIRRFKEPISELAISRFIDWIKDEGVSKGVFIGTNVFSTQALKTVQSHPNIKFIDRGGLAKVLGRL